MTIAAGMESPEELRRQVRSGQEMLGNAMTLMAEQRDQIAALENECDELRNRLSSSDASLTEATLEILRQRKALLDIYKWAERYTAPDHPIVTVAKRALCMTPNGEVSGG